MSIRTAQALASIYGGETPNNDQPQDPGVAARRAELRDLTGRGRSKKQQEETMATELRERAEAMKLPDLKKALTALEVKGASKMTKPDAVAAFVKASKPSKRSASNGNGGGQVYLGSAMEWVSDDGQFSGSSPNGSWSGSIRWRIRCYLVDTGHELSEINAALKDAKASLDAGKKSVRVFDVALKVSK